MFLDGSPKRFEVQCVKIHNLYCKVTIRIAKKIIFKFWVLMKICFKMLRIIKRSSPVFQVL